MERIHMRTWNLWCRVCEVKKPTLCWNYDLERQKCDVCNEVLEFYPERDLTYACAGIIGDEIPGGLEIKHGLCNPDGSPRKYYSKTEIYQEANKRNLKLMGDTPGKPYKVNWDGKRVRRYDEIMDKTLVTD